MTPKERILAVLNGEAPDKTPFAPFSELIPRASFERDYRNGGMGFIVHHSAVCQQNPTPFTVSHWPDRVETAYITSCGTLREEERFVRGSNGMHKTRHMIQSVEDYPAVIAFIDAYTFSVDRERDDLVHHYLGDEGVTHEWTGEPPYMEAQYYLGLENWSYHQVDYPDAFAELLAALEHMQERRMRCVAESSQDMVCLGNLAGNFSPEAFRKYMLPYFQKYTAMLREAGLKTTVHADALNLKAYKDVLPLLGVDIVEAFTPPPVGDFSLADARAAWGEKMVFLINFPETLFYHGYGETYAYTAALLKSDPCPARIIGLTEMGFAGASRENVSFIQEGVRAVLDAVNHSTK